MHLLIGTAVYRAYHPGGAQHVTPVLIAEWQGQGKSSLAACVLPPGWRAQWFGDGLQLNMSRKEVAEVTAKKVIVEIPEMSGLRRAELATLKSWLTTSDDGQHRGAYAHTAESQPRRWSGVATCDKAEALPHDPAGQRRWLAVAIGPKTINDMDAALDPVRAQLWAHTRSDNAKRIVTQRSVSGAGGTRHPRLPCTLTRRGRYWELKAPPVRETYRPRSRR